jgi:hypothetical protein
VSVEKCAMGFSGVVVVDVAVRDVGAMNSGSSEASREDGIESVREAGPYITTTSACGPRTIYTENSV